LGSLFPGQTLTVKLINTHTYRYSPTNMIFVYTSKSEDACKVSDAFEIEQTHSSHTCSEYKYTILSDRHECEIYLGPEAIPEVFYVTLNPCPLGFTLQKKQKSCYCDKELKYFTTSCNLQDQTILRPRKSWISGKTSNKSPVYSLSLDCPFDYCLPHAPFYPRQTVSV